MLARISGLSFRKNFNLFESVRSLCATSKLNSDECYRHPILKKFTCEDTIREYRRMRKLPFNETDEYYHGNCVNFDFYRTHEKKVCDATVFERCDCRNIKLCNTIYDGMYKCRCLDFKVCHKEREPCGMYNSVRYISRSPVVYPRHPIIKKVLPKKLYKSDVRDDYCCPEVKFKLPKDNPDNKKTCTNITICSKTRDRGTQIDICSPNMNCDYKNKDDALCASRKFESYYPNVRKEYYRKYVTIKFKVPKNEDVVASRKYYSGCRHWWKALPFLKPTKGLFESSWEESLLNIIKNESVASFSTKCPKPPSPMLSGKCEQECQCQKYYPPPGYQQQVQQQQQQQQQIQQVPQVQQHQVLPYYQQMQMQQPCMQTQASCDRSKLVNILEQGRCNWNRVAEKTQCEIENVAQNLKHAKDQAAANLQYQKDKVLQETKCSLEALEDQLKYQKEKAAHALTEAVKTAKCSLGNIEQNVAYKKDQVAATLQYQKDKALQNTKCNLEALEENLKYQKEKAACKLNEAVENTKYHINELSKNVVYQKEKAKTTLTGAVQDVKCKLENLEQNIKYQADKVAENVKHEAEKVAESTKCGLENLEKNLKYQKEKAAAALQYHKEKAVVQAKCALENYQQNAKHRKEKNAVAMENLKSDLKDLKCKLNTAAETAVANVNYKVKTELAEQNYKVKYGLAKFNWFLKWQLTYAKYHADRIAVGMHNFNEKLKKEVGELIDYFSKCGKGK